MSTTNRSIRLSQVISNFGVGAVYDILGESLVLMDISNWNGKPFYGKGKKIIAERLVTSLQESGFPRLEGIFEPKHDDSIPSGSLPFMRFPAWLFCSKCRRMKKWVPSDEKPNTPPYCAHCTKKSKLTPMRFIVICENGHMSDVDWPKWAHSNPLNPAQHNCQTEDLVFNTGFSKSGGLDSVAVKCLKCEAFRTLESITAPNILATVKVKCYGKQPWQSTENAVRCNSKVHVVQRGAGNVYYPIIASALTIPPESQYNRGGDDILLAAIRQNRYFPLLNGDKPEFNEFIISKICADLNCEAADVVSALNNNEPVEIESDIETEEWVALTTEIREADDRDKFVTKHVDFYNQHGINFTDYIDRLVSVIKLREVRALTGFYRYHPGGNDSDNPVKPIKPDLGRGFDWLPGLEVFGEGVFITFNERTLAAWEKRPAVIQRTKLLKERYKKSTFASLLTEPSARFILLHTLSHLLIRRLAFECGYSSASLRERIYSKNDDSNPMAGILIYTAAGDSEGTLGGLARQAESSRFAMTFLKCLEDATNCSTDPICMESTSQGIEGLNLAACHACTLVSETSCTSLNLLLDRWYVVSEEGYFPSILESALEKSIQSL